MPEKSLAYHLMERFADDREKLERYVALAELCPLPAFMIGRDKKTVYFVNAAYRLLTGRSLSELQEAHWIDLVVHPDDQAEVRRRWASFVESGDQENHRHRYVSLKGLVTDAVTIVRKIETNGYVGFILPYCLDDRACPLLTFSEMVSPDGFSPPT